jgi:hypothetical protein
MTQLYDGAKKTAPMSSMLFSIHHPIFGGPIVLWDFSIIGALAQNPLKILRFWAGWPCFTFVATPMARKIPLFPHPPSIGCGCCNSRGTPWIGACAFRLDMWRVEEVEFLLGHMPPFWVFLHVAFGYSKRAARSREATRQSHTLSGEEMTGKNILVICKFYISMSLYIYL